MDGVSSSLDFPKMRDFPNMTGHHEVDMSNLWGLTRRLWEIVRSQSEVIEAQGEEIRALRDKIEQDYAGVAR